MKQTRERRNTRVLDSHKQLEELFISLLTVKGRTLIKKPSQLVNNSLQTVGKGLIFNQQGSKMKHREVGRPFASYMERVHLPSKPYEISHHVNGVRSGEA